MKLTLKLLFLNAALTAPLCQAADDDGKFSVRGAGLLSCEAFTTARREGGNAYAMIGGWIDGYVTGINSAKTDTYDITSYQGTELLLQIMNQHCMSHPQHRLSGVVTSIVSQLDESRTVQSSPLRPVAVEGLHTALYVDTLLRVQQALAAGGLMQAHQVTGAFDEPTRQAVARYQEELDFEATGFPDQATLWHLLGN